MRFGPRPAAQAAGWTLAHAVSVDGARWPKGLMLTAEHATQAAAAGVERLWVARAGADDLAEGEAARRLAAALAGAGVEARAPVHGRVNLHATAGGLVEVDRAGIDRWNMEQHDVAVSTALPHTPVAAGAMVATVKTIPFAVPCVLVGRLLAQPPAPLAVRAWRPGMNAVLIQSQHEGTAARMLDKTQAVTAARLAALEIAMVAGPRPPHEVAPLAAALAQRSESLLLVAGASATSDPRDVVPAAIEAAGGRVLRVGMPVDPGNLLVLGETADGRPVLGLPGCARSPRRNGLDLMLERFAAGLPLSSALVAGMGVGGLFEEAGAAVPWMVAG